VHHLSSGTNRRAPAHRPSLPHSLPAGSLWAWANHLCQRLPCADLVCVGADLCESWSCHLVKASPIMGDGRLPTQRDYARQGVSTAHTGCDPWQQEERNPVWSDRDAVHRATNPGTRTNHTRETCLQDHGTAASAPCFEWLVSQRRSAPVAARGFETMPRALASVAWHRWTGAPCWCPARDAWPIRARSTGSCAP